MLAFSAFPGISFGGSAIVWADYNNDGFTDAKAGGLWRNDGGTGFTQVDGLGVGSWGDYNNDGFLDYVDRQSNVSRNNGDGTFSAAIVNGSPSSGPKEASTFFDLEGDGDLDFYIAGYEDEPCGFCPVADNVYEYDSASDTFNLIAQPGGRNGRGLSVLDYNEDLLDDVYVTNYRLQPNNLWENLGTGNFNSYPDVAGSKGATGANGHGGGSAVGDFNNDGLVDIFSQNFAHPGQSESRFLINQGPSGNYGFTDLGPNGVGYVESYLNSAAGDVDNDGDLDVWISAVYGEAARLYVNNLGTGTGSFSVSDATSGYGLGGIGVTTQGAFADIDNDGDLDFMTGEGTLFVNDTSQTTSNNWLRVKLVGDGINVNAHAFGTVVRADLGNGTILSRHVEGSTGRASNQNEQTLHFGLGAHSGPVPLEIIWRDGTVKNVTVDPNQTVTLNYNDIAANEMEIGEVGVINTLTHVPQTVTLDRHFDNPVVFAQSPSYFGTGATVVRVKNVQSDRFDIFLAESSDENGLHNAAETVSYVVLEAGSHTLSDGTGLEVGAIDTAATVGNQINGVWESISFSTSFSQTPVVLSQVQTNAGSDYLQTRHNSTSVSSFNLALEQEEGVLSGHGTESVGYLAIDGEGALTAIAPQVAIGEVGQVTNLTHVPQTILLERQYSNPVVFAQSASSLGAEPVVVRVNNVQSDRFSIYLAEPSNLNGLHNSGETATYVVFEEGTYELAHGAKLEVGQLSTDSTVGKLVANEWDEIRFSSSFGEAPVVFSQIQTNHGQNYLYTRHLSASPTNVFLALEQEEQFTEQHGLAEKVGYMAIESGAGIWSGLPFEVFNTPAIVTDTFEAHSFVGNYSSSTPRLLSQMATYQDSDNSNVRYDKIGKTEVEFKVSEDTTLDPETSHTVGESVAYLALDGDGILTAAPTIVKPTVNEFEIGEVGAIDTLTHQSQTVLLSRPYINPVVFAQSLSFENSDPSVVRVRNVQSNRFDIFVAESPDLDGIHDDFESASYVVVEAGSYTLADGTRLEVGATDTSATVGGQLDNIWEAIDFDTSFSSTPVVLSQIQTNFGSDFLNTRYFSVSPTSVTLGLEQHEAATTQHVSERVGYLAIESGSGDWNGMNFEAGSVATVVTHQWQKIPFSNVYGTAPSLLTSMTTYSGTDNAHLRYQNAQGGSVELKVEEEMTSDTEMDHVAGEGVAYLAIGGQGTLTARVPEFAVGEVKRITDLTDQPQVVLLDRPYVNPIVFADSASSQGIAPVGVRVSNVQSDRFTIQLTEPSNENGVHGAETITYVVIEAGTHQLADGTRVEVGSVTTNATVGTLANDQWESVDFATTFTSSPVILSQIQTMSVGGEDYLQTRHDGVDKSGFQLALEQEELATGQHAAEEIGYLAIESGRGSWNGIAFEAYTTPTSVTDGWYYRSFAGSYSATTGFLSSLASYVDADRGHVRYKSLDGEGVQLRIGEDTTVDTELDHLAESVAYLAIDGEGPLTAIAAHHEIGEVGRITNLTHNQQTIILERHYTNPVVFSGSATTNGTDPVAVRVTDVQSDRFTIYLAEPSNLNGLHNADETVSYMVLEAGSHQLSNGARLEVGSVTTQATVGILVQNETETVNYSTPFHTTPVVFSQIQTDAGEAYLQTRHLSNSQSHVELALEQEEFITQQHSVPETVGYLALESGPGVWTGLPFEVYNTPAGVTQDWETQRFDASYGSSTPNLLFSLATYVGRTTQKFVTET